MNDEFRFGVIASIFRSGTEKPKQILRGFSPYSTSTDSTAHAPRINTTLVAGASQLRYPLFALFAYTGGLIWSVTFITLGYYLGETWTVSFHSGYWLPITIGAVVLFIAIGIIWHFKHRKFQP